MENRDLMCTSQAWKGPKGSTFSPNWDNTSYHPNIMMSPCPDVVKSPCQHAAKICHPPEASVTSQFQQVGPYASTGLSAMANTASRRGERECYIVNPIQNEETVLPVHNPEFRGRSFSAATASNSITSRSRCDSYVHLYPDNRSEDISRGDSSPLSPDVSPDHGGPRSRSHSIILRKTKRRPAPPTRSVSLRRDSAHQLRDNRTKSLYMDRDTATQDSFLPDLILISTPRTEEELGLEQSPAQPVQALVGPPVTNNGQLREVRSTGPCSSMSSSGPAMGITGNEHKKAPSWSESVRPSPPLRHPPSLTCKQSPLQPPAPVSPSNGQSSSQCETSPTPILTSVITGPSPLGCRMRPKSSTSPTSPRASNSRLRLSLELPGIVPLPDPTSVKSKATRRHSESSSTTKPRQRLSSSMMVMPVVTQEDLSNVRLRSVSSSDSDKGLEGSPEVIREEELEQELVSCPLVHHSPKAKPPVATKPPAHKWPPIHMAKSSSGSTQFSETLTASPRESQGDMFMVERRVKPKRSHQPPHVASDGVMVERQQAVDRQQYDVTDSHPPPASCHSETRNVRRTSPTSTTSLQAELDRKKKMVPPPVAKKPDVLFMPSISSLGQESTRSHVWSGLSGAYQAPASAYQPPTTGYQSPASAYQPPTTGYQVTASAYQPPTTGYQVTASAYQPPTTGYQSPASAYQPPTTGYQAPASAYQPPTTGYQAPASGYQFPASVYRDRDFTGQDCNHNRIRDGFFLDENSEERRAMPQMRTLCFGEQEEEELDHNSSQPTTEDLFTIIHRSKKKLLGRKETADSMGSRQGYGSPVKGTQRVVQKSSSKNDNFMAFLQRRRSNKPSSGERLSASELLKNTKPLPGQP
ncbi:NHS-like protein 2 isoform X1 [Salmo trutta]|uniref:NHS-like protein 2 isoform X1 n=1 Tax=Salmo trutta TaxID=8032 RepID=UPI0011305E10|nr:NHS-like protein 2 isoform X1 [Salmo trutta]XP_029625958.1 NHS-like protein 2 isoform X1 [Salmo trutta]XP_029625959.1 NHS-like protein 2 isoform X1 [Salmo trutta]XP_029625960.1 NHS-like protein 2 isoform X1 [Salmo trutta]XP_029625962.1 NHS-like protein 2 isoform X1 [Salmo trutta]XP_029625963.1 NHS-like protein 2 isoform X1 [Salmo trutta]